MKLLYISNIAGKNASSSFFGTAMDAAQKLGWQFLCVANRSASSPEEIQLDEEKYGIKLLHIDLARSPFAFRQNFKAYKQLVRIIKDNQIDFIHCNTPVGGILGRLAGKKCKVKKVIYQAHGFHFYKGAPKLNWLLYYPVEKWLAHYTDVLITINSEDFELAKNRFKLRNGGKVYYVPGVGIDLSQYSANRESRERKRTELGLPLDAFVMISAGDLNENKNNRVILSAMEKLGRKEIHYILCGKGPLLSALQEQADHAGLHENVHFLGYRTDIRELYHAADCFVMPSFREGLSRSIMEAMACGLPCIASKVRGNTDLIEDGKGGYLCNAQSASEFAEAIKTLASDATLRKEFGNANLKRILEFDVSAVAERIRDIYIAELQIVSNSGVSF